MRRILFLLPFTFLIISCQSSGTDGNNGGNTETPTQPADPVATLPSVPVELIERIWNEGTQIDYIFYNHPFTISLVDKPAIQHAVTHVAEEAAPLKPECKAEGRVSYQIDGNIVLDGNFYFSTGCTYFVFYENQEKKYANYMTDQGITYFSNQIKKALEMRKNVQQQ